MPNLARPDDPPRRFRLMRFYTLATAAVFAAAGIALVLLQRGEEEFFAQAQTEQQRLFSRAQAELARQNEDAARRSLLAVHEASHVNMTRLMANTMWDSDFAPLVSAAQRLSVDGCRAMPSGGADGDPQTAARRACFAELGRHIRELPGFAALDRRAHAAMRGSSVFKIKVFDLRGLTVYSSEPIQIGEDGAGNLGWKTAAAGSPASELTHRARFSAFEGVVENRDLISSYVPVRAGPGNELVGVFELYSDVTPFLGQIQAASKAFADNIASNEQRVGQAAAANQQEVLDNSKEFLFVVGGLLALLYAASLAIVRYGQRVIDRQAQAQDQAVAREQLWHREKMAALATMAANVSHEVGNPLAVIAGVAQTLPETAGSALPPRRAILEQTTRIAAMTRKIADFAGARGEVPETVDVNAMVEAVCEFQGFDRRYRRTPIQFVPGRQLPARELVPDHLNEVMMNLLQALAEVDEPEDRRRGIRVATGAAPGGEVHIELGCYCPASGEPLDVAYVRDNVRFDPARRRVGDMGARLEVQEQLLRVVLPAPRPP
jgi:signal transduction histidine kinase